MTHTNTKFRFLAKVILVLFLTNNIAPTLQFAFADSTQYYVNVDGGNDLADGLTPATAWSTVSRVNAASLLQGDTVSFECGDIWNETLTLNGVTGSSGLPVTINGYGALCGSSLPSIDAIDISNSTEINIDSISITTPTLGNSLNINNSSVISVNNNMISNSSGVCMNILNSTVTTIASNNFSNCEYGINVNESEVDISSNTFTTISQDAVTISSTLPIMVTQNTFTNIAQNAVIYGADSDIVQNTITNSCSTSSLHCAAIKNNSSLSGSSVDSVILENTILGVGSGISGDRNYGIFISSISGTTVSANSIINAEQAMNISDSRYLTISDNKLLTSRSYGVLVTQDTPATTLLNAFNGNTILQKNPDYPYIEMRDNVDGSDQADTFLIANANTLYPNYKPNTSFIRSVNYGGENQEYTKSLLDQFDSNIIKFEHFAYKPYTNTGSFATSNLLTNPDFDTDGLSWTVGADVGLAPTLSYNPVGTYLGGSSTITPAGGSADRIWITNDATLNITAGQNYLITGYAKSATGIINLRAFLHESGNQSNVYSDRIAETYASASGNTFSFYLSVKTTASDANLTLETSNPDIEYEIDSISVRRMNAVVKNTNTNEIHIFSNTGGVSINQSCPGGAPCFAYVDGVNAAISWPIAINPYTTSFVLWNGSPNILNTPSCSLNISAGSVPTGQPVTVDWNITNSLSQILNYDSYTGSHSYSVASSGAVTFIPPYDGVSTISMNALNDVGPRTCSIQVTTTNTAPMIRTTTSTGIEDSPQINGTLSGEDLNPGDTIFFEQFGTNVAHGFLTVDLSGSLQYYPDADFCGTDSFEFRAYDQLGHYADPVVQNIIVECVNDAPSAVNNTGTAYAGIPKLFNVLANDTDPDTPYVSQVFTINNHSTPLNGTVNIVSNQLEYTPNIGFSGSEIVAYRMVDQSGALSNTGTLTIAVTILNTAPTASGDIYAINEDTLLSNTLSGSDAQGDSLTFTAVTLPTNGNLNLLSNGSFTYTPNLNYSGSDSFEYRVYDGALYSSSATIDITINQVSDAPIAVADSYSLDQDTTLFIPVMMNDSDVDSMILTLTGYTSPSNGIISISGTGFDYTPNPGYTGPDSFSYRLEDDTLMLSNMVSVSLNVISTNLPPTANSGSFSTNEDTTLISSLIANDPENSTLTYTIDVLPTSGTVSLSSTGVFTYTPNQDYFGSDSFVFSVSDGVVSSSGALVDITINSINDLPLAYSGSFTITGNTLASTGNTYHGTLIGSDIETIGLVFSAATLPVNGILSMTSTGVFTYLPALGYTGSDSFSFTVNDGSSTSLQATITIDVLDNYAVLPPVLDHFTLLAPGSAYVGAPVTLSIDAEDNLGNLLTSYTGTIILSSPTDTGAILPGTGGTVTFLLADGGTKMFSSGIVFTQTGMMQIHVVDTLTSISGSISLNILDIPSQAAPTVNLVATPSSIAYNSTSIITWTSTSANSCITPWGSTLTGGSYTTPALTSNTSYSISCTGSGGTSIANVIVTVGPAPSVSPPSASPGVGPGGGGGGSAPIAVKTLPSKTQDPIVPKEVEVTFNSAPTEPQTQFVMIDPTGLLGQLFLMNRYLSGSTTQVIPNNDESLLSGSINDIVAKTIIDSMDTIMLDEYEGPTILRQILQLFIREVSVSEDPIGLIDYATEKVLSLDIQDSVRLSLTREYLLRVLEQHKKRYENEIYRTVFMRNDPSDNTEDTDLGDPLL